MKRRLTLSVVLAALALAGVLWWQSDPEAREIRRIQKRLTDLAAEVSFAEGESVLNRLSYPTRVAAFFTDPTHLEIPRDEADAKGSYTRIQIEQILTGVRATRRGLHVTFFDIRVELTESSRASAHLTSRIESAGDRDYWIQEFRLELTRQDGAWSIERLEGIRTIE